MGYGFERLWEGLIGIGNMYDGLLYALAIKGDFKKVEVGLGSRRHPFTKAVDRVKLSSNGDGNFNCSSLTWFGTDLKFSFTDFDSFAHVVNPETKESILVR